VAVSHVDPDAQADVIRLVNLIRLIRDEAELYKQNLRSGDIDSAELDRYFRRARGTTLYGRVVTAASRFRQFDLDAYAERLLDCVELEWRGPPRPLDDGTPSPLFAKYLAGMCKRLDELQAVLSKTHFALARAGRKQSTKTTRGKLTPKEKKLLGKDGGTNSEAVGTVSQASIPSDRRSRPMTLREAARLMGYRGNPRNIAKRLRQHLDDNGSRYERINRQTYVFDVTAFSEAVRPKLLPS
jgi:hypothetical protein